MCLCPVKVELLLGGQKIEEELGSQLQLLARKGRDWKDRSRDQDKDLYRGLEEDVMVVEQLAALEGRRQEAGKAEEELLVQVCNSSSVYHFITNYSTRETAPH